MKTIQHLLVLCSVCVVACAGWADARVVRLATAAMADGVVDVDCYASEAAGVRKVRAEILLGGAVVAKSEEDARFRESIWRADAERHQLTLEVKKPHLWTSETPNLYALRVTLLDASGKTLDSSSVRIGFRTIELRDGLRVNGRRVRLRGIICRPTVFPCVHDHVVAIKALGANAVRFADGAPDPAFLDACDELGLYVIDELPPNPASNVAAIQTIRIVRDVNHPCVIAWAHPPSPTRSLECDAAFEDWDVQRRPVIHPGHNDGTFDCTENMRWKTLKDALGRGLLVLPTSILPPRGEGGLAAGFADYWQLIRSSPNAVGCFIGELSDYLADGFQKNPAFDAVRDIWTPVPCSYANGFLTYENGYDFVNLGSCVCTWSALSWASGKERRLAADRELCPPGAAGETVKALAPRLPSGTEALEISVADQKGIEVSRTRFRMAWSPMVPSGRSSAPPAWLAPPRFVTLSVSNAVSVVSNVAHHTAVYRYDPMGQKSFTCLWEKLDDRTYRLDYTLKFTGPVAAAALTFDVAESCVKSRTWFGRGPQGVWANRATGNQLGRWTAMEHGFFKDVEWMEFETTAGRLRFAIVSGPSVFGVFPSSDASPSALYTFPPLLGLGVWSRIPPLGNGLTDVQSLGPASQNNFAWADVGGSILISYTPSAGR